MGSFNSGKWLCSFGEASFPGSPISVVDMVLNLATTLKHGFLGAFPCCLREQELESCLFGVTNDNFGQIRSDSFSSEIRTYCNRQQLAANSQVTFCLVRLVQLTNHSLLDFSGNASKVLHLWVLTHYGGVRAQHAHGFTEASLHKAFRVPSCKKTSYFLSGLINCND